MSRPSVFVSYSHRDKVFLASLLPYLQTLREENLVDIWSDVEIRGGDRWQVEIDAALEGATIAILLISQEFLVSTFIRQHELPRILQRQAAGQLTVLPVFISPSTVTSASIPVSLPNATDRLITLSEFQGFGTPTSTLAELSRADRQRRFVELHERIRTLAATAVTSPGPEAPVVVTIERILDYDSGQQAIEDALCLYERRIPEGEQYDHEMMVGIIRRHLAEAYGPDWKMHFLVARRQDRVVGMLVAYDDLNANWTFVSYLANDKPNATAVPRGRARHASVENVGRQLGEALLAVCQTLRTPGTPLRFLFEIDPPALAPSRKERVRRGGRLELFEQFQRFAPFKGLHLRVVDTAYMQPPLGWPPIEGWERKLLLCYAAPNLFDALTRFEAAELLRWVYLSLYDGVVENPAHRDAYSAELMKLLTQTTEGLPESVPLLRNLRRRQSRRDTRPGSDAAEQVIGDPTNDTGV